MTWRGVAAASLVALAAGFGAGLHTPAVDVDPPAGASTAAMHYYLANRALFAGETEDAASHMQAVLDTGEHPEALCPGVPFKFELRGGRFAFCDPDSVDAPEDVIRWVADRLGRAGVLAQAGDREGAILLARQVLAVDPYHLEAGQRLVGWLGEDGQHDAARDLEARLQAMAERRLQSIELRGTSRL